MIRTPSTTTSVDALSKNINTLATALDAASFALLHGSRAQQIEAGSFSRSLLSAMGHPVRSSRHLDFTIKARFADIAGTFIWNERGLSSIDALTKALEQIESHPRFAGRPLSITVLPSSGTKGDCND